MLRKLKLFLTLKLLLKNEEMGKMFRKQDGIEKSKPSTETFVRELTSLFGPIEQKLDFLQIRVIKHLLAEIQSCSTYFYTALIYIIKFVFLLPHLRTKYLA